MADANPTPESAPAPRRSGGLQAWLPTILNVVLMPALAYALTTQVLLPRLQKSLTATAVQARETASEPGHGGGHGGAGTDAGKPKQRIPLTKIIVNVSGSLGTRMLMASVTLAGTQADLKTRVEENADQLRDVAATILASKTIADLEKPEARNLIRAELLSQFNTVLGGDSVTDLFLTEFAIQ